MTEKSPLRRRPTAVRLSVAVFKFILSQWQVLGIGIAVLLAYLFPNVARRGGIIESQYAPKHKTRLISRYTISYGAIGIIFLVSGLSIPRQALIDNFPKIRLHLIVQVISYLVRFHLSGLRC
jgi:solute carrier family 10 (sodium/bile acid cotransporter), member 7